jgi:transposase
VETGQALDHQPGSGVCPEKSARDRLLRLVATHPTWALGCEDAVWGSRLAPPALPRWAAADQPLRLVEQAVAKDAPDPKALACYGLLVRWSAPDGRRAEAAWLRFAAGRPVSARTTEFLAWCCRQLATAGKEALLLVWDQAPWHVSQAVRQGIRAHNQQVKRPGRGARILNGYLPSKSPWLNPIEPQWAQGKRRVSEPDRLLSAAELRARVCAAFDCPAEDLWGLPVPLNAHPVIPEQVA